MARMPGAHWLGEHSPKKKMKRYDIFCIHTIVGFAPAHAAHFSVHDNGRIDQSRDTKYRSAANLDGNHRVIASENEDAGKDVPLTEDQIDANAHAFAWAHKTHGVPLQLAPNSKPGSRGLAYHRQGVDGNFAGYKYPGRVAGGERWSSSYGKVCPRDKRIAQLPEILRRAKLIAYPPKPAPKPKPRWKTIVDKVLGANRSLTLQTVTANVRELPRHDDTIAATFKAAATGCQLAGFQETGNPVYVKAAQAALPNHQIHGLEGDPQHNVSMGFDKLLFRHVASGYRKLFDGEDGISHTRHALWVELELISDPSFHIVVLSMHYPAGAFDPSGAQRKSGDRIPRRVAMWNEANSAAIKLLEELAAKGPMVVFADMNRQKVKALPDVLAGRKTHAIANALDWTIYIDGAKAKWTTHEANKVDIGSDHRALQNRVTLKRS